MSNDLVRFNEGVLVLPTGEIVDAQDPAACAIALDELRQLESRIKEMKTMLADAIDAYATAAGKGKTLHLEGVQVTLSNDKKLLWDAQQLEQDLREAGMGEERIREIILEEVSYKVSANEAKKAASVNPDYARAVEAARTEVTQRPSVSVKRS